jgi:hypothetical protein
MQRKFVATPGTCGKIEENIFHYYVQITGCRKEAI